MNNISMPFVGYEDARKRAFVTARVWEYDVHEKSDLNLW